ncbi:MULTISPECIES: SLC13 family permease [unclassified Endozoicomonas]|uniref:SLC13 family permease n=1 Tax=unclassified Endozoicomonas TaxID=2644528 RepID=UPI003BB6F24F
MPYIVPLILALLVAALLFNKLRPAVAFVSAVGLFIALGYISLESALNKVVNPALVTLVLLILVSLALEKTPFVTGLSDRLFKSGYRRSIVKMFALVSSTSALINNTAVVASLLSTVRKNKHYSASRVLLPLSYASIFGGGLTLIGSSTNMIVNSLAIQEGIGSLGFFTFTKLGLVMAILGCLIIALLGKRALPDRKTHVVDTKHYFIEARVTENSSLVGKSIADNGLRNLGSLFLAELIREGELISPVSPKEKLHADDVLVFSGDIRSVHLLNQFKGLVLFDESSENLTHNLSEVFISHQSSLLGKTIRDVNFRTQFDAAVVAVRRGNERLGGSIGKIRLRTGDSLILATGDDFQQHNNLDRNFYLINGLRAKRYLSRNTSILAILSFLLTLLVSLTGFIPMAEGLAFLLGGYLISGVLSLDEIRRRFPFELLTIVTATLAIAEVIISSGTANLIADTLVSVSEHWGVMGALIAVYFMTLIFTEIINNNAAAALVFPIAIEVASRWNAEPLPFIIAIIFGASASFISPFGYATNLMVYSAGNYRIQDYVRLGLPLSVLYSLVVLILIPLFFPF